MPLRRLFCVLAALLLIAAPGFLPVRADDSHGDLALFSKQGAFVDVRADLEDAIINRGYVIEHNGLVGDMLARTAKDTGSGGSPYTDAQYFTFCSATLSARMMVADPRNLGYCPYVVFVYERAGEPGTVHLGYRKLAETGSEASRKAVAEINAMLGKLVREAAQ